MLKLSPLEQEAFDILCTVRDAFAMDKKVGRQRFTEVMGKVRTAIVHLDNKTFGCWSGKHACACTCTEGEPGCDTNAKYRDKYRKGKMPCKNIEPVS